MKIRSLILIILFFIVINNCFSQTSESEYIWPKEPEVLNHLKKWQGYKFGIIIHMGLYSELGTIESWGLCPEDWITRPGYENYCDYAKDYRGAKSTFNPLNINTNKWARAIKEAGAKYVIFTTKHHDGFCLFDTKYTNFKVTDNGCPFSTNPNPDLVKSVFQSLRENNLAVGAYFSKPDWTTPYFWWPNYPPKDRNPNYDIKKHSDRWKKFINYTQEQIYEITSNYGKIDILWLDGCWVRPFSTINKNVEEFCKFPDDLDIDMKTISEKVRQKNPEMLIVDRWVQGEYENYLTPEQKAFDSPILVPWEACVTMGYAWGWIKNDKYKSTAELIQLLVKTTAKGGNLLLGIGPNGKGEFESPVYERLHEMGNWMKINGEAIYETTPIKPYIDNNIAYTSKGNNIEYAIYMPDLKEKKIPDDIIIKTELKGRLKITLKALNKKLDSKPHKDGIMVNIPKALKSKLESEYAIVIKIEN